ncbi:histone deacetylase family protein [Thioalkalivibrio paradoxus]|uniref:Deacetylase n=1 Tax=Thioalkalivibrio paradoxus ARh 1 TaxID=713585 RepID=W0DL63_9GAMM|nr:histone deacetylase family protein [Thioalkalivibrio paradoxus]AHE97728.1 deacetylase [Thioalkalivibrio paradoxus ARh 1]
MKLFFISHPDCPRHRGPGYHPESPERLAAIDDQLIASGIEPWLRHREAPYATREQLLRVHSAEYLDALAGAVPGPGEWTTLDGGDTYFGEHSLDAAHRAAGAVVLAVDLVLANSTHTAFCSVRPPGHHAGADYGMGFCVFNNVAVGAAHAMEGHGLSRVAIVDFDVHHGNGTEDIFRDEPRVLFCSSFQHPFYPHRGADTVSDHILNLPLPAGTDGAALRAAVEQHWLPALDAFRPELILVSAGFDGHLEDDMASFRLVESDYAWLTGALYDLAKRHCDGRLVSVLEGGYNLSALSRSVAAHLKVLSEA